MGAGSVGCFIGGAWLAAGCRLSFLGREPVRQELAEHGIRLSDQEGWSTHVPPSAIEFATKPAALKQAGVIALCVKSTGTEAAAKEIAAHAKPETAVISFQNGISNAATLKSLLPKFDVIHGMIPYNVVRLGPGRWHRATWGELTAADTEVARSVAKQIGEIGRAHV